MIGSINEYKMDESRIKPEQRSQSTRLEQSLYGNADSNVVNHVRNLLDRSKEQRWAKTNGFVSVH